MAHVGLAKSISTDLQVIRYNGLFDFKAVYDYIYNWLKSRYYEYYESRHKDKAESPRGSETKLFFNGDKKVTEFVKYDIDFKFHLWECKDVEVVIDGKKKMMTRGRLELQMKATIKLDWQNRYNLENPFYKLMYYLLVNHIINRELLIIHFDPLEDRMHTLEDEIRKVLKMTTHDIVY